MPIDFHSHIFTSKIFSKTNFSLFVIMKMQATAHATYLYILAGKNYDLHFFTHCTYIKPTT